MPLTLWGQTFRCPKIPLRGNAELIFKMPNIPLKENQTKSSNFELFNLWLMWSWTWELPEFYCIFLTVFRAPKSISFFISTVFGCDSGNRTHIIAVNTWRLKPLSYGLLPEILFFGCQWHRKVILGQNYFWKSYDFKPHLTLLPWWNYIGKFLYCTLSLKRNGKF